MKATRTMLRALLFLLLCPLLLVVSARIAAGASPLVRTFETGAIASVLTLALTILFVRGDALRLRDVGVGADAHTPVRWALGFLLGLLLVALQEFFLYAGGHVHWAVRDPSAPFLGVLLALAAYLAAAWREELAFRGYFLRRMESATGPWIALLIMSFAFGLEHAAGGWSWSRSMLGPPAGALLFGMAALSTRGIAVPLGIHAAFNFGQWFMGQKEEAGPLRLVVDAGFEQQAEMLGYFGYLAGTLSAALGLWLWRRSAIQSGLPANR